MIGRGSAEWWFLHSVMEAAYDAGGNLDEDDRLGDFVRSLLATFPEGKDFQWDYGDLRAVRESVKGGKRVGEKWW